MDINVINDLIKKRDLARKNKNFNLADNLRKLCLGVEIQDGTDGVKWKWLN